MVRAGLSTLTRRAPWLGAAFALALVCAPGRAPRADDKSDLIGRIEDKLEDAGDALERLPDDSGDGAIDRARGYVAEARRYADELGRLAGDDSTARRIAEDFDDLQDDFQDASDYLRQMKAGMRQAEPVATTCTERERDLVRKAREYESRNDPDGLVDLPREATAVQDATRRQLDDLKRHDDRMDDLADSADDFRGDGPWRELVSSVAQTARRSLELWRRSLEQTQRGCENLARGVEHPDVKDVLSKLGSSASGRKALIEQLQRDARDLASALSGVSEDSGTGSVERARSLLQSIKRGVEALARTPTADKETRLIVEKWPEGIRQLEEAIDDLEDLKVHQHDMDPLPEKCRLKERELQDFIARNGDDPDGIDELQKLADQLAEPVRAGLARAEERMREEDGDRERARAISFAEGPWSDIRTAEQRDADETHKTYADGYGRTKEACADVVRGKDGPIVNKELERLRRGATATGDALDREVADWIEEARRTYILDCKAMETMWQAYCGTDFEPGEDGEDERAKQTAASLQSEMQGKMGPVLERLKGLEPRVQALVKKRETRARGETMQAMLEKEKGRLGRLQNQGTWRGQNNIITQSASGYGEARHAAEWSSLGCQVPTSSTSQAVFPGGTHQKPDCIIARSGQCEIWEFKPDSPKGHEEGDDQISDYGRHVPDYYTEKHRRNDAPSDANGGKAFLDELRKYCLDASSNAIVFKTIRVKYYSMCEKQYVCESP